MPDKVNTTIRCTNVAPLESASKTIRSSKFRLGIFAGNGSGKTYLSRMFRLLEQGATQTYDEVGASPYDMFLTFGKDHAEFDFKITDAQGVPSEDLKIEIDKGKIPSIPKPKMSYHVFNSDYVDENIRELDYEKDSDISGFILGKVQIDLTTEESELERVRTDGKNLQGTLEKLVNDYIEKTVNPIADIKRLNEYRDLMSFPTLINQNESKRQQVSKIVSGYISDFDKLKSIPEELADIPRLQKINIDADQISSMLAELSTAYTISSFAEDFKAQVKSKQDFVEKGVVLYRENSSVCPFCGMAPNEDAIALIDQYTKFLNGSESIAIRKFQGYGKEISLLLAQLDTLQRDSQQRSAKFEEYKTKYIFSMEGEEFCELHTSPFADWLSDLSQRISTKIENIAKPYDVSDLSINELSRIVSTLNLEIEQLNRKIDSMNTKKNKTSEDSKEVRRNICRAANNHLLDTYGQDIKKLFALKTKVNEIDAGIQKKRETSKKSRKKKVAVTIRQVLDYFFSGKYTLEEDTFRLIFNSRQLEKGQVKHVLSEGEKSIIAFAYYLGDTHMNVQSEEGYNKLIFVIDDPISSMDFTYVYTMSGVIRDLKHIFPEISSHVRYLVLTHNSDFMRILYANDILDKVVLLRDGQFADFDNNFTVPYILHLRDVYGVAKKGEKPSHTIANSIRHIFETLDTFETIKPKENGIKEYIKSSFPNDTRTYTYINDLSHGGWRSEQPPLDDKDYVDICDAVVEHVRGKYPKQISFCEGLCQ